MVLAVCFYNLSFFKTVKSSLFSQKKISYIRLQKDSYLFTLVFFVDMHYNIITINLTKCYASIILIEISNKITLLNAKRYKTTMFSVIFLFFFYKN